MLRRLINRGCKVGTLARKGVEESCHWSWKVVFLEHNKSTCTVIVPPFPDIGRGCGERRRMDGMTNANPGV